MSLPVVPSMTLAPAVPTMSSAPGSTGETTGSAVGVSSTGDDGESCLGTEADIHSLVSGMSALRVEPLPCPESDR